MSRGAKSLETLRKQLNEMFPARSKLSDGGLGDLAHSKKRSDHNLNSAGVFTARDFTHDVKGGLDCQKLADALFANKDPRIKYLIFNRRITKPGLTGWKSYTGANAHTKHLHISVSSSSALYDDARKWNLDKLKKSNSTEKSDVATSNQTANSSANNSVDKAAEDISTNSEMSSAETTSGTETTQTETVQTETTEIKSEVKAVNEQSVHEPAIVTEPQPQSVGTKLQAGIGTLLGSTMLYTAFEKFGGLSFSMQTIILISVIALIALIGFMFWATLSAWKANNRVRYEFDSKTSVDKKDLVWLKKLE